MPNIFTTTYKIKSSDKKMIELIARYNKRVTISAVNGVEIPAHANAHCSELPELAERHEGNTLYINCHSQNATSTDGIFPEPADVLDPNIFKEIEAKLSAEKLSHAHEQANKILAYFDENMFGSDDKECPALDKLDELQAMIVLNDIINRHPIDGVVRFQELNRILIQHSDRNYILCYGEKATYFTRMTPRAFDLETGFIGFEPETPVVRKLQNMFLQWKEDSYQGDFIPKEKAGFQDFLPPLKDICDISCLNDIHQIMLAGYKQKYSMAKFDDFLSYAREAYVLLGMDTGTHDFLEHTLLCSAERLPFPAELKNSIKLSFNSSSSNILLSYSTLSLYMGIPDNIFYIRDENGKRERENEALPESQQLKELVTSTLKNLNKISGDFAVYDREHYFYRKANLQYNLVLNLSRVIKEFVCNPLSTASFLLEIADNIKDKVFVSMVSEHLSIVVGKFRGLRNGASDEQIDHLQTKLGELKQSSLVCHSQASVADQGIFASKRSESPVRLVNETFAQPESMTDVVYEPKTGPRC